MVLEDLQTPALLLDQARLDANLTRMREKFAATGVRLRPHLKTAKSVDIARRATGQVAPAVTVSTLREAAYFVDNGITDITYAVGMTPAKLPRVKALQDRGARISLILDTPQAARALGDKAAELGGSYTVLVEVDSGSGRGGVLPESPALVETSSLIHGHAHLTFAGLLTHAGGSYNAAGVDQIAAAAQQERHSVVASAAHLQARGIPCLERSIGSTPTVLVGTDFDGITEVRPGVYMFMDLYQAGLSVCRREDIALSVLATVIGRRDDLGYALIDAGALALSQDAGAVKFTGEAARFGLAELMDGQEVAPPLGVAAVYQEHGVVRTLDGSPLPAGLQVGARVRVLPNHACMMAAPFDRYHVVGPDGTVVTVWGKATGW